MAWYWIFVGGFFAGVGVMAFDLFWIERRAHRHRQELWRDLNERLARGLPEELQIDPNRPIDRWAERP
jgi:hypothetical protein